MTDKLRKEIRQKKWQEKKIAQGKCIICGKPAVFKKEWGRRLNRCKFHRKYLNEYNKKYRNQTKEAIEGK